MAEWLIRELTDPAAGIAQGPVTPVRVSSAIEVGTVSGLSARDSFSLRDGTPIRTILDPANKGAMTIDVRGDVLTIYESVARKAGLDVQFDPRLPIGNVFTSRFDSENLQDALNILSLQTRTFVHVIDGKTIKVGPAISTVMNDPEFQRQKVIALHNVHSSEDLSSILNVTRQVLSLRNIVPLPETNSIEVHGTASQIFAAEDLITALDIPELP
jgi:type II secretory pathway component GspD/PulD (secretin)